VNAAKEQRNGKREGKKEGQNMRAMTLGVKRSCSVKEGRRKDQKKM